VKFTFVGSHSDDLANGRPLAIGDVVDLTRDQQAEPHNARLIESGSLIPSKPQKPAPTPASTTTEEKNS
jgi:hypothetical protein